jgi:hypothetical protein
VVQVIYCLQPVDNYERSLPLKGNAHGAHGRPSAWSESPGKNKRVCSKPHLRDVVSSRRIVGRYSCRRRLEAHGRGFRSRHSRLPSDNALASANVRHLVKNVFAQICGFAQSRNRVFPRMSDHVSPQRVVVTNLSRCQIEENLAGYQALRRWFTTTTSRVATTSQSRGVRRWEKKS